MLLGGSESDIEVLPLGSRTPARSVSVACLLTRSGEAKRRPRGWGTTEEAEAKQDGGERGGRGDKGRFASEVAKSFCAREVPSLCSSPSHSSSANRARSPRAGPLLSCRRPRAATRRHRGGLWRHGALRRCGASHASLVVVGERPSTKRQPHVHRCEICSARAMTAIAAVPP